MDFIPDSAIQALAAHKFQSAGYTWLDAPWRGSTDVFWIHGFLLFIIYFPCLSMIQTMSLCHWTLPAAEEKMDPFWTCPLAVFLNRSGQEELHDWGPWGPLLRQHRLYSRSIASSPTLWDPKTIAKLSDKLPDKTSEYMSDRMPDKMSDRMPDYMWDRTLDFMLDWMPDVRSNVR